MYKGEAATPNKMTAPTSLARQSILGSLVIMCVLVAARVEGAGPPAQTGTRILTSDEGVEDYPSLSVDGRFVAYAASAVGDVFGGNWDVWTIALETGERRNLTAAHEGDDRFPSFAPNGRALAFWSDRDGGGYFVVGTDGTGLRRIATSPTFAAGPAVWSSDGRELSFLVRSDAGVALEAVSASGESDRRSLPLAGKSTRRFDLSRSPDERYYAYVDASSLTAHVTQIFALDVDSSESVAVTDGWTNDWSPTWSSDGSSLYFVSNRGGKKDLWRQPMADGRPTGEASALTSDVGIRHAVVSRDGRHLVYSRGQTVANVWRVPRLEGRAARWSDAEAVTEGDAYVEFIALSPDGTKLVTTSDASGNPDIWVVDVESGVHRQLTTEPTPDWGPAWSPDGENVAFYAYRSGNRDLWMMPASGGRARQLTDHPAADMYPSWSPDGAAIAFYSVRTGNRDIWVLPSLDEEPRQLTRFTGDDLFPDWSPAGDWIAFYSEREGVGRIWAVTPDGESTRPLTSGPARFPRFSRDGKKLLFTGWAERIGNIFELDLASGDERPLTELSGRAGNLGSYVLATDDRYVYFTWERNLGDLVLVDVR